uniref:Immunoglobulin domain-containing protein n=1 Tax=Cyprinus carpio TaxID=7962 RepID=A0A8C1K7M2_CYPCA
RACLSLTCNTDVLQSQLTSWHEKFNLLLVFVFLFLAFGDVAVNHTTTLFVNHGQSAKIRFLQTLNLSLFTWIPETNDITFELLNIQVQDTGTYTCTVKRIVKPPQVDLGVQRVQVIVFVMLTVALTVFLITLVICKHYSKSQCLY